MEYIYKGTRLLRCGYTTGTCAAAAAKAAALMLLSKQDIHSVDITVPKGITLTLDIHDIKRESGSVSCCVIKDSGDDPDVTDGIAIYAEVRLTESGIIITGGKGIGKITLTGLDQPVGEYAINSVPRKMIKDAVSEAGNKYSYSGGFHITISAPEGEETAKKTFNPRMGIVGGISIIGTTGIVEPMSERAVIDTIRTEANIRRQAGERDLLLTVGNYSEQFIGEHYPDIAGKCVMCSNFIGDAFDIGISLGFERILLIGHIGKLIKLGSGIYNTHSSYADGRMETLICCAALCGAEKTILSQINECVTVDAALDILFNAGMGDAVLDILAERVQQYINARVKDNAETGALIFSFKHDICLKTGAAADILNDYRSEL